MPPRLALRTVPGQGGSLGGLNSISTLPVCFFCCVSAAADSGRPFRRQSRMLPSPSRTTTQRSESTVACDISPRKQLEGALVDLQKHAPCHINLSRIQLALQGLRQEPGKESVRLAILGLGDDSAGRAAKGLLRSILADPLGSEQEWEKQLEQHDDAQPLIVRIRPDVVQREEDQALESSMFKSSPHADGALSEISVSSPTLNGHGLEILLTNVGSFGLAHDETSAAAAFEEAALVPQVDIPMSSMGRSTQFMTPVHKTLVVADGILGAASVVSLPMMGLDGEVAAAVNLKSSADDTAACPFIKVDIEAGKQAVALFRQNVSNAMEYERLWFKSNVHEARDWLLAGALSSEKGMTKPALRQLIDSVLRGVLAMVQAEEASKLSSVLRSKGTPAPSDVLPASTLSKGLAEWAENAHAELREQLDIGFTGRRWRKLGWWKLFWRVDDVGMLSSEMISQRFLPRAERDIIYLAGRVDGAGIFESSGQAPGYPVPGPATDAPDNPEASPSVTSKWPTHIVHTKRYLLEKTVPALQALAQKLVVQTLSTSTLATTLGILAYMSSFGAYESGAVAAMGTIWSLRMMQIKWERTREYWEGEVREEGRKAVRAAEASIARVLDQSKRPSSPNQEDARFVHVRSILQRAEDALANLK